MTTGQLAGEVWMDLLQARAPEALRQRTLRSSLLLDLALTDDRYFSTELGPAVRVGLIRWYSGSTSERSSQ